MKHNHTSGKTRQATPAHSPHPARGFTKSAFNFKKAKKAKKAAKQSRRINRKK